MSQSVEERRGELAQLIAALVYAIKSDREVYPNSVEVLDLVEFLVPSVPGEK